MLSISAFPIYSHQSQKSLPGHRHSSLYFHREYATTRPSSHSISFPFDLGWRFPLWRPDPICPLVWRRVWPVTLFSQLPRCLLCSESVLEVMQVFHFASFSFMFICFVTKPCGLNSIYLPTEFLHLYLNVYGTCSTFRHGWVYTTWGNVLERPNYNPSPRRSNHHDLLPQPASKKQARVSSLYMLYCQFLLHRLPLLLEGCWLPLSKVMQFPIKQCTPLTIAHWKYLTVTIWPLYKMLLKWNSEYMLKL